MFAEWMERHDMPGKLILLDQNPVSRLIDRRFPRPMQPDGDRIEHVNGNEFHFVNAETKTFETNHGKLTYSMAALVPPHQAICLIRSAGLGKRWA